MRIIYLSIIESRYIDPKMRKFLAVTGLEWLNRPVPLVRSVATCAMSRIIAIWKTRSIG